MKRFLLAALPLLVVAGCAERKPSEICAAYETFAGAVHAGDARTARGLLANATPPSWTPRMGRGPDGGFYSSAEYEFTSVAVDGDTARLTATSTVTWQVGKVADDLWDWFARGEPLRPKLVKTRFRHAATLRRVDGAWRIDVFEMTPLAAASLHALPGDASLAASSPSGDRA